MAENGPGPVQVPIAARGHENKDRECMPEGPQYVLACPVVVRNPHKVSTAKSSNATKGDKHNPKGLVGGYIQADLTNSSHSSR